MISHSLSLSPLILFPSNTSMRCIPLTLNFISLPFTLFPSTLPSNSSHLHLSPIFAPLTPSSSATKKSAAKDDKEDDTVDDLTMSPFDAEELLAGLEIPGWVDTVQADMASANWQQKADAVTAIGQKIEVPVCVCVCSHSWLVSPSIDFHFRLLSLYPALLPFSPFLYPFPRLFFLLLSFLFLPPLLFLPSFPSFFPLIAGHGGGRPVLSSTGGVPVLEDLSLQDQQYQHHEGR